jgi:hypothetical protein
VVERSPEKAGVGGSTPSLATMFCEHLPTSSRLVFRSNWLREFLNDHAAQATELCYPDPFVRNIHSTA